MGAGINGFGFYISVWPDLTVFFSEMEFTENVCIIYKLILQHTVA
jgi:hypothetical protein